MSNEMDTVIKAEGVGKKYILSHQNTESYTTLRDTMAQGAKNLAKKVIRRPTVTPTHEEFWALKDVSFEIKRGDRVGIIGRNAAGKSTLLKVLSRITNPTTGKITLHGRVASLLEVGTGFHPELTGRENIYLNGAILGMSRTEIGQKFDEIVAFAEIEKFLDTPVKRYSSGMYVRLAFAVAAHLEPEILIVDEVLAVGDAQFQKKCLGKMEEVGMSGRTVIFVSHNMAAIKSLCDKALLFKEGKLVDFGEVDRIIEKYSREFSANRINKIWAGSERPRNNVIVLNSVELESDNKYGHIDTDSNISVRLEYNSISGTGVAGITLMLFSGTGECVFSSFNNQDKEWYGKPLKKGGYQSTCIIPGQLLNQGQYRIDLILFEEGFTHAITLKDVLSFEIHDGHGLRNDYFGAFSGFIRPKLKWINTKMEKNNNGEN